MTARLKTECPQCQRKLNIAERHIGRKVQCPRCKNRWVLKSVTSSNGQSKDDQLSVKSISEESTILTPPHKSPEPLSISQNAPGTNQTEKKSSGGTLGRFELLETLGSGSFGVVYKANDPVLGRTIALKIPKFGSEELEKTKRFLTEAHAAASLKHPNIVAVYECGEVNGKPFIASEFVEGKPLSYKIKNDPPDFEESAQLVRSIAEGLAYAHNEGVIHRDIKPDNIMIADKNRPQIMDFGLAKLTEDDSEMTQDGQILGTPAYMSPEQAQSQHDLVGPKSDQYSLGVILYELLTGERPYSGPPLSVLAQVGSEEESPDSININPEIPRDLSAICHRSMQKDPEKRYANCEEMAEDLSRWLSGIETVARPLSAFEKYRRWYRKNRTVARLWTALAVLVLVMVTIASVDYGRTKVELIEKSSELSHISDEQNEILKDRDLAQKQFEESQQKLATSYYQKGKQLCESESIDYGLHWINKGLSISTDSNSLLNQAARTTIAAWMPVLHKIQFQLDHESSVHFASYTPDGSQIITASMNAIHFWDAKTGDPIGSPVKFNNLIHIANMSPDGNYLAIASNGVRILDLKTKKFLKETVLPQNKFDSISFHPDRKHILLCYRSSKGNTYELRTFPELTPAGEPIHSPKNTRAAISPNGSQYIVGGNQEGESFLIDANTFEKIGKPLKNLWRPRGITYSPDSQTVVTADPSGEVIFWDTKTGEKSGNSIPLAEGIDAVNYSPDGTKIAIGGREGTCWLVDPVKRITGEMVLRSLDRISFVKFSPDGKNLLVASRDRTVRVWQLGKMEVAESTLPHPDQVASVYLNPDGKTMVTNCMDGTLRIWNIETGQQVGEEIKHPDLINLVAYSPDGKIIASGCVNNVAYLWDSQTGKPYGKPLKHHQVPHSGGVRSFAFSSDSQNIISFGTDRRARVWKLPDCTEISSASFPAKAAIHAYNDQGIIVFQDPSNLSFWNLETKKFFKKVPIQNCMFYSLPNLVSHDGKLVISGEQDGRIRIFQMATGEEEPVAIKHPSQIQCATFTSDDSKIITGSLDGLVRIWDVKTGKLVGKPLQHERSLLMSVLIDHDKTLVTVDGTRTGFFWDLKSGRKIGFPIHQGKISWGALDTNGRTLVTGGIDHTAKIWKIPEPVQMDQQHLTLTLETQTGQTMDENGNVIILTPDQWREKKNQLSSVGQ